MSASAARVARRLERHLRRSLGLWRAADPTTRRLTTFAAAVTGAFAVVALLAPALAPYGQAEFDGLPQLARPSLDHLFGTTTLKYDVLSRVIYGSRLAFGVVLLSTTFALVVGVPLGLAAGYTGRRLDRILVLIMDALYAFPSLLLAIVAAFALRDFVGQGVPAAALSISVIYVPQYFRVVRNHTLAVREEPFVDAARAMGARPLTIVTRYIAANVLQSVPVIFTVNAADAVLTLAGLGFLGYGVPPRTAEWGYDIAQAISDVGTGYWWTSLFPGLGILGLVTALSLLGEGVNDVLNPRLRQAGLRLGPEDGGTGAVTELAVPVPVLAPVPGPPAGPAGVLVLAGVSVTYPSARGPVRAVHGVDLHLTAGESLGLVGESGCGKSSLGRVILGLLPPGTQLTGTVAVDGTDLTADPDQWRRARGERIAMVFQDPATRLDPLQRVEAHFTETIRAHRPGVSRAQARRMAAESLASVGVPAGRARQYPHEFSGGMRQRIMIGLGCVLEPRVLVADEPTTSLDVLVEAQVLRLLDDLRRERSIGVVLITHNLGIVAETCDRVAVMYAGRIVEEGPVADVFARPHHPYTQGLLASVITLDTTEPTSIPGAPPDLADLPPGCPFAARCPMVMDSCRQVFPATVSVRADSGRAGSGGAGHRVACHLYPGAQP